MSKKTAVSTAVPVLCLGIFTAASVSARRTGVMEYHQMVAGMMIGMTGSMSHGDLTPEPSKWMSQRRKRMLGLDNRPAMKEPELKMRVDQMRKQVVHSVSSTLSGNSYRLTMY